jgi:predicted NUDIX family NTP pyrophosphohydrolase
LSRNRESKAVTFLSGCAVKKQSAGVLAYKTGEGRLLVFLVHPGGPFWAKKDIGAWSIPKGEFADDEDGLTAARREFAEETGQTVNGPFRELTPCRQKAGKLIHAWAVESDVHENVTSNEFEMEWPPKSGRKQMFPEVDRAAWFTLDEARERINPGQRPLLDELAKLLPSVR